MAFVLLAVWVVPDSNALSKAVATALFVMAWVPLNRGVDIGGRRIIKKKNGK
jgi:hypothetical protein